MIWWKVCTREQPRGRGEHRPRARTAFAAWGTAPRARGAHVGQSVGALSAGNSPAGAGSTAHSRARPHSGREQPRGRGEHLGGVSARDGREGTAPRARGARALSCGAHSREGNSPAGAGSTRIVLAQLQHDREQPRGRGEHEASHSLRSVRTGTAPRARGAPGAELALLTGRWNSPAGAGSTTTTRTRERPHREQPRGRGEHGGAVRAGTRAGEQPRGRGEHMM